LVRILALLATAAVLAVAALAQDADSAAWARAKTCADVRAYLDAFPKGRHIAAAKTQLIVRKCAAEEAGATPPGPAAKSDAAAKAEAEAQKLRDQLARERAAREAAERKAAAATRATTAPAAARDIGPFGVDLLHPNVRASVLSARAAMARADETAARARAAADLGRAAAERARRSEPGTMIENHTWGEPQRSARFETEWANGLREGHGLQVFTAGPFVNDSYSGEWSGGFYNGVGVYSHAVNTNNPSGALRYEGEMVRDKKSGFGVFIWSSGFRYSGGWREEAMAGSGVYRFADGGRYEGEWSQSLRNGYGVQWTVDGRAAEAGVWANGVLVQPLAP
jgi:hypothetical protein